MLIESLRRVVRGEVLSPHDAGYDAARALWNGMIDKRPAALVRARGAADVIRSVELAREHGVPLAVRAGGHGVAGDASVRDGLVIDLRGLSNVLVDPVRRTARAGAGATRGGFDLETQAFGLAVTGGLVSTTGIAGLTLGGGTGWLVRKLGAACDSVTAIDVVTAEGKFVRASARDESDLFWAMLGAGANFGVVTAIEYALHPVGPSVTGGVVVHPIEQARDVLRFYREFTAQAPDEVFTVAVFLTGGDGKPALALMVCHCGSLAEGERALAPLKEYGRPLDVKIGPMQYTEIQQMVDGAFPAGLQNYWKSNFLTGLPDAAIDTLVEHCRAISSPQTVVIVEHMGGALNRRSVEATAFPHRNAAYDLIIVSMWKERAENERHIAWTQALWQGMQPHSTGGVYVNMLGGEGDARVRSAYGPNYPRLAALKAKYDPDNVFRSNHNIVASKIGADASTGPR